MGKKHEYLVVPPRCMSTKHEIYMILPPFKKNLAAALYIHPDTQSERRSQKV